MGHRKRILVVDDNERVRFIIGDALGKLGDDYQIVTAGDGRTALDKAKETYYDLLITDLRLPRSDGLALTAAFATVSPRTTVIWITAYGCHRFASAQKSLDVSVCLNKPIEIQDIRRAALDALMRDGTSRK
ncbi:MAG: response regulator [Anaerolineae bacterium]|nr:response regulator [Anaerolineae bacterium]